MHACHFGFGNEWGRWQDSHGESSPTMASEHNHRVLARRMTADECPYNYNKEGHFLFCLRRSISAI